MKHLDHPSPHFNDAKMARFCFLAPSSLLWGDGGLSFHFVLSEIVRKKQPKARRPTNNTRILRIFSERVGNSVSTKCRLQTGCNMQTGYKMQTEDCRLSSSLMKILTLKNVISF